jgi:hypothetical protein
MKMRRYPTFIRPFTPMPGTKAMLGYGVYLSLCKAMEHSLESREEEDGGA